MTKTFQQNSQLIIISNRAIVTIARLASFTPGIPSELPRAPCWSESSKRVWSVLTHRSPFESGAQLNKIILNWLKLNIISSITATISTLCILACPRRLVKWPVAHQSVAVRCSRAMLYLRWLLVRLRSPLRPRNWCGSASGSSSSPQPKTTIESQPQPINYNDRRERWTHRLRNNLREGLGLVWHRCAGRTARGPRICAWKDGLVILDAQAVRRSDIVPCGGSCYINPSPSNGYKLSYPTSDTQSHTHTQCGKGRAGPSRSDEDWAESHQRSRRCLRLNNVSSLIKLSHRFRSRAAIDLGRCFRLRSAALPCAEERLRCTLTSIKRNKSLHRTSVQKDPPWARAGPVPLACFSLHFGAIVTTYSWGARVFSPAWTSGRNCDSDSSALGSFYRTWDGAGHLSDAVFSSSFVEPCTEKRKIR